jgi:hypothetical protein
VGQLELYPADMPIVNDAGAAASPRELIADRLAREQIAMSSLLTGETFGSLPAVVAAHAHQLRVGDQPGHRRSPPRERSLLATARTQLSRIRGPSFTTARPVMAKVVRGWHPSPAVFSAAGSQPATTSSACHWPTSLAAGGLARAAGKLLIAATGPPARPLLAKTRRQEALLFHQGILTSSRITFTIAAAMLAAAAASLMILSARSRWSGRPMVTSLHPNRFLWPDEGLIRPRCGSS